MSKVDAQRAMKEARYAALMAQASTTRRGTPIRPEPVAETPARARAAAPEAAGDARPTATKRASAGRSAPARNGESVEVAADPTAALCGHRSIANKSCQRPAGHTEKNHRYK
jgi:hypothetical protein